MKPKITFDAAGDMTLGVERNGKLDLTLPCLILNETSQRWLLDVLMARFGMARYQPVANALINLPWAIAVNLPTPEGTLNRNYATGEWELHDQDGNRILRFRMDGYDVCVRVRVSPEETTNHE